MKRVLLPLCFTLGLLAQSPWRVEKSGTQVELRGLSVVNAKVAWASGMKGTVLHTVDGEHWKAMQVPGTEKLDFRDVEGIDANTAYVMSAGPGEASTIYKTTDGGTTWKLQVTNSDKEGFWDAMAFWDSTHGMVFGDPVKEHFQALVTSDGGATWIPIQGPGALPNEGGFAASGTCLSVWGSRDVWFATGGGKVSRVLHSGDRGKTWSAAEVPVPAAAPTKGLFSVAFLDAKHGVAVGGDYGKPGLGDLNGVRSEDGGRTWKPAQVLHGFMSVVVSVPGARQTFVAAGLGGSAYSIDRARTWTAMDSTPVNTVGFADPSTGWAVGPKGLLMKYVGRRLK